MKVEKLITDNAANSPIGSPASEKKPSGEHVFDRECVLLGIEHRLIKPRQPRPRPTAW
jgi:hypothetical protein